MDAEFLKGFSKDPETRKQAEHIWKMLDQMAEDNPDGYKTFVKQNIEEGTKDMKKKQDDSLQAQMVTPVSKLAFKMFANLTSKSHNVESSKAEEKFNLNQASIFEAKATISKLDKRVKFYINLMTHPNVMYALNQKREELNFNDDIKSWQLVPLSFSQITNRSSTSFGYKVYFVDVVMNDQVYEKILGQIKQTDEYFLNLLRDTFQMRLMNDRNPIQVDFKILQTTYYYEFEKLSCNRLKNKQYRQFNNKGPIPLLLEYQINKIAQGQIKKKQQDTSQDLKFKKEEDQNLQQIETNIENKLGIDSKKILKTPLIQEIQQKEPEIKIQTPTFTINNTVDAITMVIHLPQVTNFSEIDLNISKSQVKLSVNTVYELEHQLSYSVNNDNLAAKWDKKNHKLTLKMNKI